MAKSILDYILLEDREAYFAIIDRAAEAKANAPKAPRAPRAPMSDAAKLKATETRLAKLQAKLEAMRAAHNEE